MRIVYHLVPRAVWEAAPASAYQADSLATEGFIHCSNAAQVAASANRFFANEADLLVLHLDAASFGPLLRDEVSGTGEVFPHVYGPIERARVLEARPLERGPDGRWTFTP